MNEERRPAWCRPLARGKESPAFRRIRVILSLLILVSLFISPDASAAQKRAKPSAKPKGITHTVRAGQTLFRISHAYQVKVAAIMEANRLKPSTPLKVGQRLFIPGAKTARKVETYRPLTREERGAIQQSLSEEVTAPPPAT